MDGSGPSVDRAVFAIVVLRALDTRSLFEAERPTSAGGRARHRDRRGHAPEAAGASDTKRRFRCSSTLSSRMGSAHRSRRGSMNRLSIVQIPPRKWSNYSGVCYTKRETAGRYLDDGIL